MMKAARKPDAFKAPAAQQDDEKQKQPGSKIDAFERMMNAARVPGIFAPSVSECIEFVKESPKIREIIGIFRRILREREEQADPETKWYSLLQQARMNVVKNSEYGAFVGELGELEADPWLRSQYKLVPTSHPPLLQPWSERNFEGDLTSENISLRMGFVESLRNTGAIPRSVPTNSVPPPPTEPSRGTHLVGIKVHFDSHEIRLPQIMGFTMIYNDNVEIPIGQIKATKNQEFKLSPGEHIVAVQGAHKVYEDIFLGEDGDPVYWLIGIRFLTTKDRWMTADPEGGENVYIWDEIWDDSHQKSDFDKPHHLESGAVLHSIDFRPDFSPPIRGIQGIPIKELISTYPDISTVHGHDQEQIQDNHHYRDNTTAVPTLYTLAYDTLQAHFVKRADKNYRSFKDDISYFRNDAEEDIRGAYFDIRANIFKSEEAEMFRVMQLAQDTMMNSLTLKRHCLENRVKAEVEKTKTFYDAERDYCKGCLVEDQASIYKQHLKFAQTHGMLSGRDYEGISDNQETAYGKYALCTFTKCRKSFSPGKLPLSKRCVVEGCTSIVENCGCHVKTCKTCHEAICIWHAKDHKYSCEENLSRKCGHCRTNGVEWLIPEHCNKVMRSLFECSNCSASSCLDCMERCNGCWEKWCKRCVAPASFADVCCDDCEFPKYKK